MLVFPRASWPLSSPEDDLQPPTEPTDEPAPESGGGGGGGGSGGEADAGGDDFSGGDEASGGAPPLLFQINPRSSIVTRTLEGGGMRPTARADFNVLWQKKFLNPFQVRPSILNSFSAVLPENYHRWPPPKPKPERSLEPRPLVSRILIVCGVFSSSSLFVPQMRSLHPQQRVNHFPGMNFLTFKDQLVHTVRSCIDFRPFLDRFPTDICMFSRRCVRPPPVPSLPGTPRRRLNVSCRQRGE